MKQWNEKIESLQEQIVRQHRLQSRKRALSKQLDELRERERELQTQCRAEQADVDRLNGRSLAVWFYAVTGQKAEKLEKEQREAYEAAVRLDAVQQELKSVMTDFCSIDLELRELAGCEQRYRDAVEQKKEAIRQAGGASAERIGQLEEQLLQCTKMQRELKEAVQAGNAALSTAERILNELDSAEGWGKWDLVGGGFMSDLIKYDHMDTAQGLIEDLQVRLRKFRTELTDVSIQAQLQVNVDDFLRFADFFFDDIFSSWAVLDRIEQSMLQVGSVRSQVNEVLRKLNTMQDETERTMQKAKGELEALVLNME